MSLIETISKVITVYEARTDDHIGELKKLKKNITDTQKAELDAHESRKSTYDSWQKSLTEVNQGLELVGKAVAFGKDAFKSYAETLRLQSAAGKADIERLREASLGLRTEHELLTFAAQTQHGVFKLTQEQMETAQRAMVALTRAGFDQEEVTKKVTDALVKGKAEGLDDFGISLKAGKTDLENFTALMGALANKANDVKGNTTTAAEGVQQMGVRMGDSIDHMKQAIGELVVAMAPLLDALARAVELIAMAARTAGGPNPEKVQKLVSEDIQKNKGGNLAFLYRATHGGKNMGEEAGPGIMDAVSKAYQMGLEASVNARWSSADGSVDEGKLATFFDTYAPKAAAKKAGGGGGSVGSTDFFGNIRSSIRAGMTDAIASLNTGTGKLGEYAGQTVDMAANREATEKARREDYYRAAAEFEKGVQQLQKDLQEQRKTSFLETNFGKLEDFHAYAEAFGMLSGAVTSAMDAWITGSMSMGDAIKKSIGSALTALASQMAIEALKHGAYAIGSLAFGDVAGATTHGIAAAEFGAAAVAAGVAARAMGHGGQDYGKSGGKGASAGGGSRPKEDAGSTPGSGSHSDRGGTVREIHTFTFLDPFSSMNETDRKAYAQKMVNKAVQQASARR